MHRNTKASCSFVRFCGFEAIGTIVTDHPLPPDIQEVAAKAGTAVLVASSGPVD